MVIWRYSQRLFHSYGELWLGRGELERAMDYADECLAGAEESDSRKNVVKGRRLRGQILLAKGELAEAERWLLSALAMAQEVGNPKQLWQTNEALGDLRKMQERSEAAEEAYRSAMTIIQEMAAGLDEAEQKEILLGSTAAQALAAKLGVGQ